MSDFLRGLHHDPHPHPKHVTVTIEPEPAVYRFQVALSDFIERVFGTSKITQDDVALVAGPR